MSVTNMFSVPVGCLFVVLLVSFAMQKRLNLIMHFLVIFAFISFHFGEDPPRKLLQFKSKSVLLMFSCRNFL